MEFRKRDAACAIWPFHLHDCLKRRERHAHVAGMRRDALVARTQDGMDAVVTFHCAASAAWLPFIARHRYVIEVVAPRPLQQVAAVRRGVPQLRGGARQDGLAEQGITLT